MRRGALLASILILLTHASPRAEVHLGMAGASSLLPEAGCGLENPANAALATGRWITPVAIGGRFGNDSYTLRDYDRWNGSLWTDEDKQQLLSRIKGPSLEGEAAGEAVFALGEQGTSIALRNIAAGKAEAPREWAELALYGNAPGRRYQLAGARGHAIAYSEVALNRAVLRGESWLLPVIRRLGLPVESRGIALGASIDLMRGWGFAEIARSEGMLLTTIDAVNGGGLVHSRTSEGGLGIGLDLGVVARSERWSAGLSTRHLPAWIWWNEQPRFHRSEVTADSLTLDDSGEEDLIDQTTESRAIPGFRRALPAAIRLAVARRLERWHLELDLEQGLSRGAEVSTRTRGALGAAFHAGRKVELRGGLALGGVEGAVLAAGLGLTLGGARVDLCLQSIGSLEVFQPRGLGGGIALTLSR